MRHRARARKLSRTSSHRIAMYRNLVTSLLDHERVETTDAKAKELRRLADRMITLGKRGDLHARRRAMRVIRARGVTAKVFGELAERYRTRPGGYTRVLKTRRRVGDAAAMSIVELVEPLEVVKPKPEKKSKKAASRKKAAAKAPEKKTAAKTASKKAGTKKASGKKISAKKTTSKKTTAKKTTRKKATTSKASATKSAKSKKPRAKSD
jgi:large subunit ribosomal protein L17